MSSRLPSRGKTLLALRWYCWAGNMLAWLTVLIASFSPRYHWLQRSGYMAAFFFSVGGLVLLYRHRRLHGRLQGDEHSGVKP